MNLKDTLRNTFGFPSIQNGRVDMLRLLLVDLGIPAFAFIFVLVSQNHVANYLVLATATLGKLAINTYLNRLEI